MEELKFLEEQNVSSGLIKKVLEFREMYPVPDEAAGRITKPAIQPAKIFCQKIWHIYLTDRHIMYLFM